MNVEGNIMAKTNCYFSAWREHKIIYFANNVDLGQLIGDHDKMARANTNLEQHETRIITRRNKQVTNARCFRQLNLVCLKNKMWKMVTHSR